MKPEEIIPLILSATHIDAVGGVDKYKEISKAIHPDSCSHPQAGAAQARLNELRLEFVEGLEVGDEVGRHRSNGYWLELHAGNVDAFNAGLSNYRRLWDRRSKKDEYFQAYMPSNGKLLPNGKFHMDFRARAVRLHGLQLPQEHVNWILNRLLEFSAYLEEIDVVHAGLTPEAVFITPEDHGLQVATFYHSTPIGMRLKTVSGPYLNWYPQHCITDKIASPQIDVEMAKRLAAYLLGDRSGMATQLKKTHKPAFIDFLQDSHDGAHQALGIYRKLLKDNFEKKFHILNL